MEGRSGDVRVSKLVNRFEGMSTLRGKEREQQPKSDQAKALEKYLQKYTDTQLSGDLPRDFKQYMAKVLLDLLL